jgi:hypothetical protein
MTLNQAFAEVSRSSAGDAPFLMAYGSTFLITGILSYLLPTETVALMAMFQGGAALPVAFWLERRIGQGRMAPNNPLRALSVQLAMSQAFSAAAPHHSLSPESPCHSDSFGCFGRRAFPTLCLVASHPIVCCPSHNRFRGCFCDAACFWPGCFSHDFAIRGCRLLVNDSSCLSTCNTDRPTIVVSTVTPRICLVTAKQGKLSKRSPIN